MRLNGEHARRGAAHCSGVSASLALVPIFPIATMPGNFETCLMTSHSRLLSRLAMLLFCAISGNSQVAAETEPKAPVETIAIVGKWRWFDAQIVAVAADGTFTAGKGRRGIWKQREGFARDYILVWDDGLFTDNITISPDGQKLSGRNNKKEKIKAERIP
jgi:hypothetical protein